MSSASTLQNLFTARDQVAANIVAITLTPKPSYSIDGVSVPWAEYLASQTKALDELNKLIISMQPYRLASVAL